MILDLRFWGKNLMHNTLVKRFLNSCSDNRKSKLGRQADKVIR